MAFVGPVHINMSCQNFTIIDEEYYILSTSLAHGLVGLSIYIYFLQTLLSFIVIRRYLLKTTPPFNSTLSIALSALLFGLFFWFIVLGRLLMFLSRVLFDVLRGFRAQTPLDTEHFHLSDEECD